EETINADRFVELIKEHGINRITVVPSLLPSIIRAKRAAKINLDGLKYVFCSGETLTSQLANDFYAEFSDCQLYNIYGSTEVSADATCHYVDRFDVKEVLQHFKNLSTPQSYADKHLVKSSITFENNRVFTQPNIALDTLANKLSDSSLSSDPVSLEDYYDFLDEDILPFTIDTASPTFIGHMTSVLPDYVHDLSKLISQMNQNLVKIETSKSITFLEREAIAILHRLFYNLPNQFYDDHIQKVNANLGIITSGGTIANISALLAARNKGLYKSLENRIGNNKSIYTLLHDQGYRDMVFIGTQLMHYSFKKALSILGLGSDNMLFVQNDEGGSMITSDLQDKIDFCKKEKLFIIAIVGIAGSTERGSVDPLIDLGNIAKKNNIHFHVDAAWGGSLMFSEKYKHLLSGIEQADSITFCGHKQLFLPQGISVCLFKDPTQLGFNSTTANYQAQPNSYDFGRFTIEGSRPALSICLHASLRILGKGGFGLLVENGIENAKLFARIIKQTEGFELLSRHMNIINYRYIPEEFRQDWNSIELTNDQVDRINQVNFDIQQDQFYRARTFVSKTTIQDQQGRDIIVFRVVLSNPLTTHEDLVKVIEDQILIVRQRYNEHNQFTKNIASVTLSSKAADGHKFSRYAHKIPIGKAISNMSVFILDANDNPRPDIHISPGTPAGWRLS
ncbi:MAG: aminotransferase class V-fold PLP-dependent enzyme, partial [Bacteroidota bacterium]